MKKGFTLLEILLVIAAIGILAAIVIVAINPNRQLAQARNAQRRSDVNTILNAVYQYSIDKQGFPAEVTTTLENIASTDGTTTCANDVGAVTSDTAVSDFVSEVTPDYLSGIPRDPQATNAGCSDFTIQLGTGNRVTVAAPLAEIEETISVER